MLSGLNNILKLIFSVSNENKEDKYHKVICILGFKIKFWDFRKELIKKIVD